MRSLLTVILTLTALLGRDAQAAPAPPDKGIKKDEVIEKIKATREQLNAPDEATRRAALKALGNYHSYFGAQLTATRVALLLEHDPSEAVRLQAATVLESIGPAVGHDAVFALAKALKDKSRKVRIRAAEALNQIGPRAKLALPALLEALKDKDTSFRRKAVSALSAIGPPEDPDEAVSALIKALKDKDDLKDRTQARVPPVAALTLGSYGAAAAPAVPALIEATRSPDSDLRVPALIALGRIRAQPKVIVPLLLRFLKDKDHAAIRCSVAAALGHMGPRAKDAVPSLFQVFTWDDINDLQQLQSARSNILDALVRIRADVPKVLELLLEVFQDKKDEYGASLRREAAVLLGHLGPAAAKAIPVLLDTLNGVGKHREANMEIITGSLAEIGEPAVGPLVKNLSTTNRGALYYTMGALRKMGAKATPAIPALRKASQSPDRLISSQALRALRQIEGH